MRSSSFESVQIARIFEDAVARFNEYGDPAELVSRRYKLKTYFLLIWLNVYRAAVQCACLIVGRSLGAATQVYKELGVFYCGVWGAFIFPHILNLRYTERRKKKHSASYLICPRRSLKYLKGKLEKGGRGMGMLRIRYVST